MPLGNVTKAVYNYTAATGDKTSIEYSFSAEGSHVVIRLASTPKELYKFTDLASATQWAALLAPIALGDADVSTLTVHNEKQRLLERIAKLQAEYDAL